MTGKSIRIGRIAGIPIGVQPLWLVIVALLTWTLGDGYYPSEVDGIDTGLAYLLGFVSALLLFACILAHELGHAVVARRRGVQIEEIDLWLLGGVARMKGEAHRAQDELAFALAGPAVTLAIALVTGAVVLALPQSAPDWLEALLLYQVLVNGVLLVFNLIPAFPLDGGRVARALMWRRHGDLRRATIRAATLGRYCGWGMIGLGLVETMAGALGGLWLALIGFFIVTAARGQAEQVEVDSALAGYSAGRLMSSPAVLVPADLTLAEVSRAYFVRYGFTAFPVTDGATVIGLVTLDRVRAVPAHERDRVFVRDVADSDPALFVGETANVTELLERPAFARLGRAIVLGPTGAVSGIVSITDVRRAIRAMHLLDRNTPGLAGR